MYSANAQGEFTYISPLIEEYTGYSEEYYLGKKLADSLHPDDAPILIHHEIKHNITINRNYGEMPIVSCYPGRLNQVFLNILINGKQSIKDKGVITITTYLRDNQIHIEFKDNGVGIAADKLRKIFDPGFTTKGVGVGAGLGLSICYQIMQDHGGRIEVESEVGKGSTFRVVFPADIENS